MSDWVLDDRVLEWPTGNMEEVVRGGYWSRRKGSEGGIGTAEGSYCVPVSEAVKNRSVSWLTQFQGYVEGLAYLPWGWDSYGAAPPNERARSAAQHFLRWLWEMSSPAPLRMAPINQDGVIIWLDVGDRKYAIECFNDGEISIEAFANDDTSIAIEEFDHPEHACLYLEGVLPLGEAGSTVENVSEVQEA